jgi:hypothetical protein
MEMVIAMQPDASTADALPDEVLRPSYWLVSGLDWQISDAVSEAAVAVAPAMIPRDAVSYDTRQVLGCADLYVRKHGQHVVFFSDLTRMFADAGTSWSQLGIDWEKALQELRGGLFPALFLTISELAYVVICDPAVLPAPVSNGDEQSADDERELVRTAVAGQLMRDWPPYVQAAGGGGPPQARMNHAQAS